MNEYHIYIYGAIAWDAFPDADFWGIITADNIRQQIQDSGNAETLIVHVNSPGGEVYEGLAIFDLLVNSGKKIITVGEGLVASIASVIFLAGTERRAMENMTYMIHKPWQLMVGESDDLRKAADEMDRLEDKITDIYEDRSTLSRSSIKSMLKEETFMGSNEMLDHQFATEIINTVSVPENSLKRSMIFNAFASSKVEEYKKFVTKNKLKMSNQKTSILDKITNALSGKPSGLTLNLEDGSEVFFKTDAKDIDIQMEATDGKNPLDDGEYILQDKRGFTIENGLITNISQPEMEGNEGNIENKVIHEALTLMATTIDKMVSALNMREDKEGNFVMPTNQGSVDSGLKDEITSLKNEVSAIKQAVEADDSMKSLLEQVQKTTGVFVPEDSTPSIAKPAAVGDPIQAAIDAKKEALRKQKSNG